MTDLLRGFGQCRRSDALCARALRGVGLSLSVIPTARRHTALGASHQKGHSRQTRHRHTGLVLGHDIGNPCLLRRDLVVEVAQQIEPKDAPVVAGAIVAGTTYLVSYDRRHLLNEADSIRQAYGIEVVTPDYLIALIGERVDP